MKRDPLTIHWEICKADHPHCGRKGKLTGEVITIPGGRQMAKFQFDEPSPCGNEACFVVPGELREVRPYR